MTFLSLTPDALYDTWYFSHRGLGYLDNYFFCLSLMNTLLFFEWKLCLWRTNFLPQRAIFAFTWSAMLIFLLKMPPGIKVCCFQSLAVVHLVFTCEAMARLSSQYSNNLNIPYIHYISVPYFLFPFCIFFILLLYFSFCFYIFYISSY